MKTFQDYFNHYQGLVDRKREIVQEISRQESSGTITISLELLQKELISLELEIEKFLKQDLYDADYIKNAELWRNG